MRYFWQYQKWQNQPDLWVWYGKYNYNLVTSPLGPGKNLNSNVWQFYLMA